MGTDCGPGEFCAWTVVTQAMHAAAKIAAAPRWKIQAKNERGMNSSGTCAAGPFDDATVEDVFRFLNFDSGAESYVHQMAQVNGKTGSTRVSAATIPNKMFIPCSALGQGNAVEVPAVVMFLSPRKKAPVGYRRLEGKTPARCGQAGFLP
jgi:hypothetical protein